MDLEKIKMYLKEFKYNKKFIFLFGIIICIIIFFVAYNKNKESEGSEIEPILNTVKEEKQDLLEEVNSDIYVHIFGAVRNCGLVVLDGKARIIDAIEAAGGLTENADISKVNLAYEICDGLKIYIPSINESRDQPIDVLSDDGGENVVEETSINKNKGNKKVNINSADKSELENLTGIGPSIAERIVDYRKTNGKFKTIDDIKNVAGIGNSKFEAIKNDIVVK